MGKCIFYLEKCTWYLAYCGIVFLLLSLDLQLLWGGICLHERDLRSQVFNLIYERTLGTFCVGLGWEYQKKENSSNILINAMNAYIDIP